MTSPLRGPIRHDIVVEKYGKKFCAAPFNSLHEGPEGLVSTCCKSREPLGFTNKQSIEEMYNSDHAKDVRRAFLEGRQHPQCVQCWHYEDQTGIAAGNRQSSNMLGFDTIDEAVANTLPDGTMVKQSPAWLDLLWSNKCNFACLGCKPEISSTIAKKYREEYAILNGVKPDDYYPNMGQWETKNEAKIRYVIDHADSIEVIHLNGGEPFMAEGIYELLDEMMRHGLHRKIRIWSHTNGSITKTYKGKDIVEDYLVHWGPLAKIVMSQDGHGTRGEYTRYGYRDRVWLETFRRIREAGVELKVQTCWNMLNALTIDEIGAWYMDNLPPDENGKLDGTVTIWKNMTLGPEMLRFHEPTRQKGLEALQRAIESERHPADWATNLKSHYKYLSGNKLPPEHWPQAWLEGIAAIDRARGTDFDSTFPELLEFKEHIKKITQTGH